MKKYKFTDMKSMLKLLAFFCSLLLSSLANKAYSQIFTQPNNSFGTKENRGSHDSAQYLPTFPITPTDTFALHSQGFNGKGEKLKKAAIYYDSTHHKGYLWDPALKAWFEMGSGAIDTIIITPIGVGSPQIQTLWTSPDGNQRTARLVPGLYTIPFINPDSGVGFNTDTTMLATWLKIVAQYGPPVGGNIYTIDGKLQTNRHLSGSNTHSLFLDSIAGFNIVTDHGILFRVNDNANLEPGVVSIGDVEMVAGKTRLIVDDQNQITQLISPGGFQLALRDFATTHFITLKSQAFDTDHTLYLPSNIDFGTDTLITARDLRNGIATVGSANLNIGSAYRFAVPGTNNIKTLACTGCTLDSATTGQIAINVSTAYIGPDTVTTITAGSSSTVPDGTSIIRFNNTSPLTYTLTLGTNWHSSHKLLIAFTANGTITRGSPMVTLTIVNGSGHTQSYAVDPSGVTYLAGENIGYTLIGTVEQRIAQ